ncbi:MAG: hypothetical protein DRI34_09880 [Deltaproteobacteria bacterium]|nr:MAG: hypothetical protein DRI34_09880 [Deltaproteobacteria bacterium]
MRDLMGKVVWLAGILLLSSSCGGGGAEISIGLNLRDLCQRTISGESEQRCVDDSVCAGGYCWRPAATSCSGDDDCSGDDNLCVNGHCEQACEADANCPEGFLCTNGKCQKRGYCRLCQTDGNCQAGQNCDHGWCHDVCSADADCANGMRCAGGVCRRPHIDGTDFNFCNTGSSDLEVYLDQTVLYGNDDACAFARFTWMPGDQSTVVLPPDDCGLNLRVEFVPPDQGEYYAFLEIHSNAGNVNPLPILLHGQAVEAACDGDLDGECQPPCSSSEEDFSTLLTQKPQPSCQ